MNLRKTSTFESIKKKPRKGCTAPVTGKRVGETGEYENTGGGHSDTTSPRDRQFLTLVSLLHTTVRCTRKSGHLGLVRTVPKKATVGEKSSQTFKKMKNQATKSPAKGAIPKCRQFGESQKDNGGWECRDKRREGAGSPGMSHKTEVEGAKAKPGNNKKP